QLIAVDVVSVATHQQRPSRKRQLQVALNQGEFCQLALGKVYADTDQVHWFARSVVEQKAAGLYPPNLTVVGADDAKLRDEFALLSQDRQVALRLKLRHVRGMHIPAGILTRHLKGALG